MARLAAQPRLTRPGAGDRVPDPPESTPDAPQTIVALRYEDEGATAAATSGRGAATGSPEEGPRPVAPGPVTPRAADAPAVSPVAESLEEAEPAGLPRRTRIALVVGAVLALLALGAAVWTGVVWGLGAATASDRDAVLAAGRQAAVNLVSVNYNTADADIKRVEDSSTGDFASLFGQNVDSYAGIVKEGKVISTGQVTEAGVESLNGDDAQVLAAISSKVQNSQVPQGETREYRVEMSLHYQDGAWKVAKMEFIP